MIIKLSNHHKILASGQRYMFCYSLILFVIAMLMAGCATVSFDEAKTYSQAFPNSEDTSLSKFAAEKTEQHEGLSGFYPLVQGMEALGIRLRLAELAEKSIDLQYFLMKNDTTGAVIANALLRAADRGVRVRFLLDDIFTTFPDDNFLLINQHPNIEVRIFNPISRSGLFVFNFLWHFDQANRRMHNKSFIVDNAISIVGGRNLADEYFDLSTDSLFIDFDVLAVGPVTYEISRSFDEFWNFSRAVPIDQFTKDLKNQDLETVRAEISKEIDEIYDTVYEKALKSRLLQDLNAERQPLFAGKARVLSDNPEKLINEIDEEHMQLVKDFRNVIDRAENEVIFISPYFIPGQRGIQLIRGLVEKGMRVIILTNSLASNNHVSTHSAYARYRRNVIKAGAELYEARANAEQELSDNHNGLDNLTLHTKLYIIDGRKLFVGSLNLDPRSIDINAEMGLLIDSKDMVTSLMSSFKEGLENYTYRVVENEMGQLEWHTRINGQKVVETSEPLASCCRRIKAWFMKIVPESQL